MAHLEENWLFWYCLGTWSWSSKQFSTGSQSTLILIWEGRDHPHGDNFSEKIPTEQPRIIYWYWGLEWNDSCWNLFLVVNRIIKAWFRPQISSELTMVLQIDHYEHWKRQNPAVTTLILHWLFCKLVLEVNIIIVEGSS